MSGADVGHPGPGVATRPSMTGFVASVSPGAAFAVSYAGVQHPRVEMIQDLTSMVMVYASQYLNCYNAILTIICHSMLLIDGQHFEGQTCLIKSYCLPKTSFSIEMV